MSINSRTKGASYERAIAKLFTDCTGVKWVRTPGSGAFSTRTGIQSLQGDIVPSTGESKYLIECKCYADINLWAFPQKLKSCLITKWLTKLAQQGELASKKGMLIFKKNRGKNMVIYETDDIVHNNVIVYYFNNKVYKFDLLDNILTKELLICDT